MKLRHYDEPIKGVPVENTFAAFDDYENPIGTCVVYERDSIAIIPERPKEYFIKADCGPAALDALLGAATTRAFMLSRESGSTRRSRVYTECDRDDEERLNALFMLGFSDDDCLLRMHSILAEGPLIARAPSGLTLINDQLGEDAEFEYFTERYAHIMQKDLDQTREELDILVRKPNFLRLLLVSRDGLSGELAFWTERRLGVIGYIYVSPEWRRRGVGAHLMDLARVLLIRRGVREATLDVRRRMQSALRLAAASGYRHQETIILYPGIDL